MVKQLKQLQHDDLADALAKVLAVSLRLDDPWQLAGAIVEEASSRYSADISTIFQVRDAQLLLKGGILLLQGLRLPVGEHSYSLDWNVKRWHELKGQGVTPGVAIFNEPVAINSIAELRRNPAHIGRWDKEIYPRGIDDPESGFGCLYAVPLRRRNHREGPPKDVVAGVFKIERRRLRPTFTDSERAAFGTVAAHLGQILKTSERINGLVNTHVRQLLVSTEEPRLVLDADAVIRLGAEALQVSTSKNAEQVDAFIKTATEIVPDLRQWRDSISKRISKALGYAPAPPGRRFFVVVKGLAVTSVEAAPAAMSSQLLAEVRSGFDSLPVAPAAKSSAIRNLARWLDSPELAEYHDQLHWLIREKRWPTLLDSFHRVLPFGTGGRRGPVGIGTNRFNPVTLTSSIQGHVDYLRERHPDQDLAVVIAYDVRVFRDLRRTYSPDDPNPLNGITSRQFGHLAAGVYAANGIRVYMLPEDSQTYVSTPELSFAIRRLMAQGGLNISASHNHPDDNGGKFFGAHGGQEIPPNDEDMARRVESVSRIASLSLADAREAGLLHPIPSDIHEEYIRLNLRQSLRPDRRSARIVFTPLHGTGGTTVGEVLRRAGFNVVDVPEQSRVDGGFPTVPFRAPNPEVPESMNAGIALARRVYADAVFACDPDADRIGVCSQSAEQGYRFFTGNEIAAIVTHYKLSALREHGRLPTRPFVVKTEVTTELIRRIASSFGATTIGDLLVGFKYHANVLDAVEHTGSYRGFAATLDDFVIAVEESHGLLVTPELRDKDAAGAALLLAELASELRDQGRSLADYLDDIHRRYGYCANLLISMVMTGAEGLASINQIQAALRKSPPPTIGGRRLLRVTDHQDPAGVHGPILSDTDLSARNALVFELEHDAKVIVRPSGTEPKSKTYVEVLAEPANDAATSLTLIRERLDAAAREIGDDITQQMLRLIGVEMPVYGLRVSGLVPLDRRIAFVNDFLPELERRLQSQSSKRGDLASWIDAALRGFGEDPLGLVAGAVREYVAIERAKAETNPTEDRTSRLSVLTEMISLFPA